MQDRPGSSPSLPNATPAPNFTQQQISHISPKTASSTHPHETYGNNDDHNGNAFKNVIQNGHQDELDDEQLSIVAVKDNLLSGNEGLVFLALFETQQLIANCREYAIQTLVPIICQSLKHWNDNLKSSAAEALSVVVKTSIPATVSKAISEAAYDILTKSRDESSTDVWGGILVATLPGADWSAVKLEDVLNVLESRFARSENTVARKLIARILGSLAACSRDDNEMKRKIMSRAKAIASDRNTEVRGMIAESMSHIGASVKISVVENELWPCILKLVNDEDARIHAVSMRAISFISAAHREKHHKCKLYTKFIPSVLQQECTLIQKNAAEDQRSIAAELALVLEIDAQIYGELLYSCRDSFADESLRKELFKTFLAMSTCNSPVVRKYCAYNLPAVSLCLAGKYRKELSHMAEKLSKDSDAETRWTLAGGMHQTAKLLASSCTTNAIFKTVQALLLDPNGLVRMNTLAHFQELIAELAKQSRYDSVQKLTPLFENLQLLASGNWRTQELLAKQLELAASLIPPPALRYDILPMLYQMADEGSFLVRKAAMSAAATCMRYIPDVTERDQEMAKFRFKFAHAPGYTMRVAFIDSAQSAVNIFSSCLFRDTYGAEVLRLAYDVVPNVRVRIALLLPQIAHACKEMDEFYSAVQRLQQDDDMDVKEGMEDIDEKVRIAIEKGRDTFERDMRLEEEERELYSRHLLAQKEAHRRKHNMKRRPGALLGKAAKGFQSTTAKKGSRSSSVPNLAGTAMVEDSLRSPNPKEILKTVEPPKPRNSPKRKDSPKQKESPKRKDPKSRDAPKQKTFSSSSTQDSTTNIPPPEVSPKIRVAMPPRNKPASTSFIRVRRATSVGKLKPPKLDLTEGSNSSSTSNSAASTSGRGGKSWRSLLPSPRNSEKSPQSSDKDKKAVLQ